MTSLLVIGNTNQYTFGNAIIAAHLKSRDHYGEGLSKILVLHSPESHRHLALEDEWKLTIERHGINREIFTEHVVSMDREGAIDRAARHIELSFRATGIGEEPVYVDLTNGSSLYKNVYSTMAYLLGAQHPFVLIPEKITSDSENPRRRFWDPREIQDAYFELPAPARLDALGPSWLTEIRRFRAQIRRHGGGLNASLGIECFDQDHFEREVRHAITSWLEGESTGDPAALRGAVRSLGSAFEELVAAMKRALSIDNPQPYDSLASGIRRIHAQLELIAPNHEPSLLHDISDLFRAFRNVSTHEVTSSNLERIRARLATELLLAASSYIQTLASEEILPLTHDRSERTVSRGQITLRSEGDESSQYYFGLDGDDTGRWLERLFIEESPDQDFQDMSSRVDSAIRAVAKAAKKPPVAARILFSSGDDILFHGYHSLSSLIALQELYSRRTNGMTCSIGFGDTPRAAYVALKIAKARPGKNAIQGVVLAAPS